LEEKEQAENLKMVSAFGGWNNWKTTSPWVLSQTLFRGIKNTKPHLDFMIGTHGLTLFALGLMMQRTSNNYISLLMQIKGQLTLQNIKA